ncbi:MAG TPA: hypothetical protein VFL65_12615 [Jatrophihabitans sp.]|nr:hypothetical protein [Jatrophihabitans sp.]
MNHRLLIGTVAAAILAGTVGGLAASGATASPSPSATGAPGAPAKTGTVVPTPPPTVSSHLAAVAARLHVTPDALLHALIAAKLAGGPVSDPGVAAVAARLHVSVDLARKALGELFGGTLTPPPVAALARLLHVTPARAADVLDQLDRISRPGRGVDPNSTQFARVAVGLGISPQALANALDHLKQALRAGQPSPSSTP